MTTNKKSDKELAFLQDLFIAPDWGERFAELIDEHIKLPKEGEALYVAAGTGGHAMALHERAGEKSNCSVLTKIPSASNWPERKQPQPTNRSVSTPLSSIISTYLTTVSISLSATLHSYRANVCVRCSRRWCASRRRVPLLPSRLPTFSSFGEFFSIYWEALHNNGLIDHESDVEQLITELPTVSDIEQLAEDEGLKDVQSWTRIEEFDFESGEQFLSSTTRCGVPDARLAGPRT